jgi:hypothetical protein
MEVDDLSVSGRPHQRLRLEAAVDGVDYSPENALRTTAAAGFGVPFSWNRP